MTFLRRRNEALGTFLKCLARAGGQYEVAHELAAAEANGAVVAAAISKAQAASVTGSTWGEQVGGLAQIRREFLGAVTERSVLGRVGQAVPGRTRLIGANSGAVSTWVGDGQSMQVGELSLTEDRVNVYSVGSLVLVTKEMLAGNSSEVESFLTEQLVAENVRTQDSAFLDPGNAGVAGVKPRSITYDAETISATGSLDSGSGISALKADIRALMLSYRGSWASAALIGSTRLLVALGMDQILAGIEDRLPVISSGSVPGDSASPVGDILILVDTAAIRYAVPETSIEVASQGALVLSGAGSSTTTPTPQSAASLFQTGTVALKSAIVTGWSAPPPGSCVVLAGIPRG